MEKLKNCFHDQLALFVLRFTKEQNFPDVKEELNYSGAIQVFVNFKNNNQ